MYGTADIEAQPDAIFVWLSDMPDLNEQSKQKIEAKSDMIRTNQLITIDSNFHAEFLESGNVYLLNTQKLGTDKLLTYKSDQRQFTIWETLTNTANQYSNQLYIVIDEAHRGMNLSAKTENTANSIMQKFIVGSESDGLCAMSLIIGITATPQRFRHMISGTNATKHSIAVKPEDIVYLQKLVYVVAVLAAVINFEFNSEISIAVAVEYGIGLVNSVSESIFTDLGYISSVDHIRYLYIAVRAVIANDCCIFSIDRIGKIAIANG